MFHKIAELAQSYWAAAFNIIGTVAMAVAGFWLSAPGFDITKLPRGPAVWFCVGALLFAIGAVNQISQAGRLQELKSENEELADFVQDLQEGYPEVMRSMLQTLAKEYLHLRDTDRISLYRHNGTAFILMGRYAKNPVHNRRGRAIYPDHQGCIGRAWQNGKHIATGFPDPSSDWPSYKAHQIGQYGLSGDVVDALTMQSRSYVAFALDGPSSERRIAVLVIESTAAVSEAKIRQFEQVVGGVEGRRLAKFLEIWELNGPNLDYAKEEGF